MAYAGALRGRRASLDHQPPYAQFSASIGREFQLPDDPKPMTVRFDVVNVFDTVYVLRDGSGIGAFAPQYGPAANSSWACRRSSENALSVTPTAAPWHLADDGPPTKRVDS